MKIKLKYDENLGDWYRIVRAEHDGRGWLEKVSKNCRRFMMSERLSPEADIEGDKEEMINIAKAIQLRKLAEFGRVAVRFSSAGAHFCSPRNSEGDTVVTLEEADELATQILAKLISRENLDETP